MRPADTAERLRDAAFDLFQAQGFDATTVDDIAQRAEVGRTTFFRHFRAKEDVVFPDHPALAAAVAARLDAADDEPPAVAVTEAALVVLNRYVGEGERARARYRLVTSVEPLRARELASTQPYQRAFGRYLRAVMAQEEQGSLYAEVVAAAVIAVHNSVLRRWLRGACADPEGELREVVAEVFRRWWEPTRTASARHSRAAGAPAAEAAGSASGSTIVVVGSDLTPEVAAARIRRALEDRS